MVHCDPHSERGLAANVLQRTDCASAHCLLGPHIMEGLPAAYCAVSEAPDARCDGISYGSFCVGNTFGDCQDGRITAVSACRGGAVCDTEFHGDGFSATPVCYDSSKGTREVCNILAAGVPGEPFSPLTHCCSSGPEPETCYDCHPDGTCSP